MRTLEFMYLASFGLVAYFGFGLTFRTSEIAAFLSIIPILFVVRHRHRRAFRQILPADYVVLTFQKPAGVTETAPPSRWHRYRSQYFVSVLNADGYEMKFDVTLEGSLFGLFLIQILDVERSEEIKIDGRPADPRSSILNPHSVPNH